MKMKKIISLALSALMVFGMAACGDKAQAPAQRVLSAEEVSKLGNVPDYSASGKSFDFFGYSSISNGYWTEYGVEYYCGKDLRTEEQFKMYKDAGFTIMHPQSIAGIQAGDNFVYESSAIKEVMDMAQATGNTKVIVSDYRINGVVKSISDGAKAVRENNFGNFTDTYEVFTDAGEVDQTALENVLKGYMEKYTTHPAYYGVLLPDEPSATNFVGYGHVYRAIKRAYPESYTLANMLPPAGFKTESLDDITLSEEQIAEFSGTSAPERLAAWKVYITQFLDETQIDYLMYDQYPATSNGMHDLYVRGLQVAAQVCKEKGVQLNFVAQTMTLNDSRIIDAPTAAWINNMLVGLGVQTIGYFTYFERDCTDIETYSYGSSFVTHFGEKTKLYDIMQKIMSDNQKFAPTVLSFDFNASNVYVAEGTNKYMGGYIMNATCKDTFTKVANVAVDKESALVTELVNKTDNRYMYMVQNIVDPIYTGTGSYQTTTLTFNETYNYAVVWCNGERQVVSLVDNKYTVTQHPGQAVYVIPFNA